MWVQEQEIKKKIECIKIAGTINPADLGTKHLDGEAVKRHLKSWRLGFESGRPEVAPGLTKWGPQPEGKEVACSTHDKKKPKVLGSLNIVRDKPRSIGSLAVQRDVDDVDVGVSMLWGGCKRFKLSRQRKRW